jgi:Tol biopolymer transport system component
MLLTVENRMSGIVAIARRIFRFARLGVPLFLTACNVLLPTQPGTVAGRIAFVAQTTFGGYQLFVIAADGSGLRKLSGDLPVPRAGGFAWSQDGRKIAFQTNAAGNNDLYVAYVDSGLPTRLTTVPAIYSSPSWSPDGTRLAFASNRGGGFAIYIMNGDGSAVTRLTDLPDAEAVASCAARGYSSCGAGTPAWSPDGTNIAFFSNRDNEAAMYTMNVDGTAQTKLGRGTPCIGPLWSPDSARIAWACIAGLYVMNRDGSDLRQVSVLLDDPWFTWSADSRRLVYVPCSVGRGAYAPAAADCSGLGIYTAPIDGSGTRRYVAGGRYPCWSSDGATIAFTDGAAYLSLVRSDGRGYGYQRVMNAHFHVSSCIWSPVT